VEGGEEGREEVGDVDSGEGEVGHVPFPEGN
jgi:hypothetical protein